MRLLQGACLGLILGVVCGLTVLFAKLQWPSNRPTGAGGVQCGTGVLVSALFYPIHAIVVVTIGGASGVLFGLLGGSVYERWEYTRAMKAFRTVVSPHCPRCGRDATVAERNASPLCPGCGELLPRIPRAERSG
jgi:predicted RNA-binding Zn-ribbon protein involved in translation (DUF1610 family)